MDAPKSGHPGMDLTGHSSVGALLSPASPLGLEAQPAYHNEADAPIVQNQPNSLLADPSLLQQPMQSAGEERQRLSIEPRASPQQLDFMDTTPPGPDAAPKLSTSDTAIRGSLQHKSLLLKDQLIESRTSTTDLELNALTDRKARLVQDIGTLEEAQQQLITEVHTLSRLKHDLLEEIPLFNQRARAVAALAVVQAHLAGSIQRVTGGQPPSSSEGSSIEAATASASALGKPLPASFSSLCSAASGSLSSMVATGGCSAAAPSSSAATQAPASPTATSPEIAAAAAAAALAALAVSGAPADASGLGLPGQIARATSSSPVKAVAGVGAGLPARQLTWPPHGLGVYKPGGGKTPDLPRGRLQAVPESQEALPGNTIQEALQRLEVEQVLAGGNQAQQQQGEKHLAEQLQQLAMSTSACPGSSAGIIHSSPLIQPPPPPPKKAAQQAAGAPVASVLAQPPPPPRTLSSSMPLAVLQPPPPPTDPPPRRLQSQDSMGLQQLVQQSKQAVNVMGSIPATSGAVQLIPVQPSAAAGALEPGTSQWLQRQPAMLGKEEEEHVLQSCSSLVGSSVYHPDTPSHQQTRSSSEWSRTLSSLSSTLSGISCSGSFTVGSYSSPFRLAAKPQVAGGGVVATALTTQQVVDLQREGILPQPPPPPKQIGFTDHQAWKQQQQQKQQHQALQQQQLLDLLQKHQMEQQVQQQQQQVQQQQTQQIMVQQAEQAQLLHLQALDTSNEELLQLQPMQLVDLSQQGQLQQGQLQQMQVAQQQQQHHVQHQLLQLQGASMEGLRQGPSQELMQGGGMGVWSLAQTGLGMPVVGGQEQQHMAVQNTPQTLEEAYAWVLAKNGSDDELQLQQQQQGVQLVQLVGVQEGVRAQSDQLAVQAQRQQHQQHQQLTMLQRLVQAGVTPEMDDAVLKLHSL